MSDALRQAIAEQQDTYRNLFQKFGRSEEALCWSKNKQAERFAALTRFMPDGGADFLDYGCGLGDLKSWLAIERPQFRYQGVDILPEFIDSNRQQYPSASFSCIGGCEDVTGEFDYCAISGVFNLRTADLATHEAMIAATLTHLFGRVRRALSCDFLAPDVSYRKPDSHHQEIAPLAALASTLSRRYIIDKSYLPYEFCVTIFKDSEIDASRTIYRRAAG